MRSPSRTSKRSLADVRSRQHYLRGESGVFYDDLYHLVSALPKYSFPSSVEETDHTAFLTMWRHPGTAQTFLPANKAAAASSADSRRRSTTTDCSSTGLIDVEKGIQTEPTLLDLAPASNPPVTNLYHYFPPLLIFRVSGCGPQALSTISE